MVSVEFKLYEPGGGKITTLESTLAAIRVDLAELIIFGVQS